MPRTVGPSGVWLAVAPETWPASPTQMSVSSIREIDACPRRWAIKAADYPEVWDRRGYPPRLFISSVAGSVVHLVLKTITEALVRAGCRSVQDAGAVQVLRDLGGYSEIIEACIQQVLQPFFANPRAVPMIDVAIRALRMRTPDMRTEAQTFLGRLSLQGSVPVGNQDAAKGRPRVPLGPGMYPELELIASQISWHGTADLLMLSEHKCEIVDFKTGARDVEHVFQLLVYALLWIRDSELNPTARPADRLVLSYRDGEVHVDPPLTRDLDELERKLIERSQAAARTLNEHPPQARPSVANCSYCEVRQICEDYWQPTNLRGMAATAPIKSLFMDLQISIRGRHGPSSWDGLVERSSAIETGRPIVLRTPSDFDLQVTNGDKIRILNAQLSAVPDDSSHPVVGTVTATSEVFFLGPGH
jgi:PD-(D/E)XK nuclease superfamily